MAAVQTSTSPAAQPREDCEPQDPQKTSFNASDDVEDDVEKQAHDNNTQADDSTLPSPTKTPPEEETKDPNLVEFDGPDDPGSPKNFGVGRKIAITCAFGAMSFVVTFSSSIFSVAIEPVAIEYGVTTLTSTLGVTVFLLVCLIFCDV